MQLQLVDVKQWWAKLGTKELRIQIFWHRGQARGKPERWRREWGEVVLVVLWFICLVLLLFYVVFEKDLYS